MTDLRTAAQQALEVMKSAEVDPHSSDAVYKAITALKAALVEDAMQKFTDVNQELQAALGCDHCNSPLYAAVKCRVCGRVTEPAPPQRNPVEWDGRCMLGHCNSPAGCENSGECRAVERAHGIGGQP